MKQVTTYVGVDAHKKDLFIAMLVGAGQTPVTWTVPNEPNAVKRLVRKLERKAPGPGRACYDAGPCGYALQRQATTARVTCQVIAPALIPRKPGERVKTNRRDARKLAELLRAGLLTEVRPPTPEDEAGRDLCRARDDAREDLQRGRHRLGKLLLRRGLHYPGRNWTRAHRRWVDSLRWTQPAERAVVDDYLLAIDQLEARLLELDTRLREIAATDSPNAGDALGGSSAAPLRTASNSHDPGHRNGLIGMAAAGALMMTTSIGSITTSFRFMTGLPF